MISCFKCVYSSRIVHQIFSVNDFMFHMCLHFHSDNDQYRTGLLYLGGIAILKPPPIP